MALSFTLHSGELWSRSHASTTGVATSSCLRSSGSRDSKHRCVCGVHQLRQGCPSMSHVCSVEQHTLFIQWPCSPKLSAHTSPLHTQVVLGFHACGCNVGDDAQIPLPEWVLQVSRAHYHYTGHSYLISGQVSRIARYLFMCALMLRHSFTTLTHSSNRTLTFTPTVW